jgi:hypothetical protein
MARPRSPDVAVARARLSGLHNGRGKNRPPDDPKLIGARQALKDAREKAELDAYIEKLVDAAPPLTAEQRTKLAELLKPVRVPGGAPR